MVYFLAQNNFMIKIGYSKDIRKRINSLKTASPYPLLLLGYVEGDKKEEKRIQEMFCKYNVQLEWFQVNQEILNYINENTLTNTFCDIDEKGILRVYKKMKK